MLYRARARALALGNGVGIFAQEIERRSLLGCEFGSRDLDFGRRWRNLDQKVDVPVALETGSRRDQAAHDDVFLEAAQVVHLAGNRRFGENARGLLEAGRRNKGVGGQRGLGDAEEQRAAGRWTLAFSDDAVVLLAEAELIHLFVEKE